MPKFEPDYAVETPGMLADPIKAYLESLDKRMDNDVLHETVQRMRQVLVRDLMQPRDTRAGKESNTLYTGACARKARLTFDGADREPLRARTLLKFLLGDLVELCVLAIARLAGCHIEDNNIDLTITGDDGVQVPVHPDGRYVDESGTSYNVEIKSCDSQTFDRWMEHGGPDDAWGYLTQASVEVKAWREAGVPVLNTIFVAVSTGSRQGSIAEFVMPYNEQLVIGWHDRRLAARQPEVPAIPFEGQPEMAFMRGKAVNADWFAFGEPTPRVNDKGATYGWDVMTGRTVIPLVCSYCDFKAKHCWKDSIMEMDGAKPVWVIPAPASVIEPTSGQNNSRGGSTPPEPSDVAGNMASGLMGEQADSPADPSAEYRTRIQHANTAQEATREYNATPETLRQDCFATYQKALQGFSKKKG